MAARTLLLPVRRAAVKHYLHFSSFKRIKYNAEGVPLVLILGAN